MCGPDLPFGGLFDFNGDGVMDSIEDFIAYNIVCGDAGEEDDGEDDEDD